MKRSEKRKGGREGEIDSSTTSWLPPFLPSCPIVSGIIVLPLGMQRERMAMEMGEEVDDQIPSINYPASQHPSINYPASTT